MVISLARLKGTAIGADPGAILAIFTAAQYELKHCTHASETSGIRSLALMKILAMRDEMLGVGHRVTLIQTACRRDRINRTPASRSAVTSARSCTSMCLSVSLIAVTIAAALRFSSFMGGP